MCALLPCRVPSGNFRSGVELRRLQFGSETVVPAQSIPIDLFPADSGLPTVAKEGKNPASREISFVALTRPAKRRLELQRLSYKQQIKAVASPRNHLCQETPANSPAREITVTRTKDWLCR
jgi:hypothetical protein